MKGTRLKELRRERGLTLDKLAELIGTSKQTIHRYENGVISNIPPEKVEGLAYALGTTPSELMGWDDDGSAVGGFAARGSGSGSGFGDGREGGEGGEAFGTLALKKLPILGEIACGEPIYAMEERGSFVSVDGAIDADFCLRAHGDSMIGARIYDGDIVFIRQQSLVNNGEIAAVIINDEATLKRVYFYPEEGKLVLSPENPRYAPLVYVRDELNDVKILGRAIAFQSAII